MPRHSYDVQQLIYAIARSLDGVARVSEWLLFRSGDGTPREVDVAIESTAGVRPVRIAVEYRDHARPADATWIEQLVGKYRDLPVQHLVVVAKAGFSPAARARAAAYEIRTLTLAQAHRADWARLVNRVAEHTLGSIGADVHSDVAR